MVQITINMDIIEIVKKYANEIKKNMKLKQYIFLDRMLKAPITKIAILMLLLF